jgi:hypothetical protein
MDRETGIINRRAKSFGRDCTTEPSGKQGLTADPLRQARRSIDCQKRKLVQNWQSFHDENKTSGELR